MSVHTADKIPASSSEPDGSELREGFAATPRGFHVTFANGWTISVQFAAGNYCANYDSMNYGATRAASPDAEIAVFKPSGAMVELDSGDTVWGYRTPADVLQTMIDIAAQ